MNIIFKQTDPCIDYLINSDPLLGKLIKVVGEYSLHLNHNYYQKLAKSIVGQQLSLKAKETIWYRVKQICGEITPENMLSITDDELRSAGVSFSKISYIKGLSQEILNGRIDLNNLESKADDDVIEILMSIRGIGKWTAEMFLIFSLGRLNVFSSDDASLRRAIKWLYGFNTPPTKNEMHKISSKWVPYCSVASLYLWASVDGGLINTSPASL